MNIIDVLEPLKDCQEKTVNEFKGFLLEAAKLGLETAKDFHIDVAIMPQLQKLADTLNLPLTVVITAVGGDVIHVEVTPTVAPEVKAGGAVA